MRSGSTNVDPIDMMRIYGDVDGEGGVLSHFLLVSMPHVCGNASQGGIR